MRPKILIIAASLRAGSHNARLASLAAKELAFAEAEVTRVSLADYPLPIFDADLMADSGLPLPAIELKRMLTAHRGVFIATPEYSASVPPLLKNAIDWMSRGHERGEPSYAALFDADVVNQTQIEDIVAELRVDHLTQRVSHEIEQRSVASQIAFGQHH